MLDMITQAEPHQYRKHECNHAHPDEHQRLSRSVSILSARFLSNVSIVVVSTSKGRSLRVRHDLALIRIKGVEANLPHLCRANHTPLPAPSRSVKCSRDRYAALGFRTGKATVHFWRLWLRAANVAQLTQRDHRPWAR